MARSEFAITGVSSVARTELPSDALVTSSNKNNHSNYSNQVRTMEQLKKAELRGENISIGEKTLIQAIEKANKALQGVMATFEFSIHEETKQIMVKVKDKDTGELIREIPPEKTLDLVAKIWELAGILVDERR